MFQRIAAKFPKLQSHIHLAFSLSLISRGQNCDHSSVFYIYIYFFSLIHFYSPDFTPPPGLLLTTPHPIPPFPLPPVSKRMSPPLHPHITRHTFSQWGQTMTLRKYQFQTSTDAVLNSVVVRCNRDKKPGHPCVLPPPWTLKSSTDTWVLTVLEIICFLGQNSLCTLRN